MRKDLPTCSADAIREYEGHAFPIHCGARVNAQGEYVEGKCLIALLEDLDLSPTSTEGNQCPKNSRAIQRRRKTTS